MNLKLGNKVRILDNKCGSDHPLGVIGTITYVSDHDYRVFYEGNSWFYLPESLELLDES